MFWFLELVFTTGLLLGLVLSDSFLNLKTILLFLSEFLIFGLLMLLNFSLSVVKDLIKQVDSGFLSFLPIFLLLSLLFDSFNFYESIKFSFVGSNIQILVSESGQNPLGFFSLLLFQKFFVFGQLSFFRDDSLDHLSISSSFLFNLSLFLTFNLLVLLNQSLI